MNTMFKVLICVSLIAIAAGMYATRQLADAQSQIKQLRGITNQVAVLKNERDNAIQQLANVGRSPRTQSQPRTNEVQLAQLSNELVRLRTQPRTNLTLIEWGPQQLTNAGRATPSRTLQTYIWANLHTNVAEIEKSLIADTNDPPPETALSDLVEGPEERPNFDYQSVRVLSSTQVSTNEVWVEVQVRFPNGEGVSRTWAMRQKGREWRLVAFSIRDADGKFVRADLGIQAANAAATTPATR